MPDEICPQCGGLGVIRYDLPVNSPDFGKLYKCPDAEQHAAQRREQLYAESGLMEHERFTLENLVAVNDMTSEMIYTARKFLEKPRGWLYLWGGFGTSKSAVLQCIATHFIEQGIAAYYTSFVDLRDVLLAAMNRPEMGGENFDAAWQKWKTYEARLLRFKTLDCLCIDEMDPDRVTGEWTNSLRGQLMDHRYRSGTAETGGTVTVFAGNQDPKLLPDWLADRIFDGRFSVFENRGRSVRPAMSWLHDI